MNNKIFNSKMLLKIIEKVISCTQVFGYTDSDKLVK